MPAPSRRIGSCAALVQLTYEKNPPNSFLLVQSFRVDRRQACILSITMEHLDQFNLTPRPRLHLLP